jgi:hypothetical protein
MNPSEDTARIAAAVQEANDAFWSVIVDHFPEAKFGDFDMDCDTPMTEWVTRWVHLNADPLDEDDDMTDKIVYLVTDHGVDGRARENIMFASFDETERDAWYDTNPNRNYYSKTKRIIEVEKELNNTMRRLDGVARLLLDIEQRPAKK